MSSSTDRWEEASTGGNRTSQLPGGPARGQRVEVLFQTPGGAEDGKATTVAPAEATHGTATEGRGLWILEGGGAEVHRTGVVVSICRLGAIASDCDGAKAKQ